MRLEKANRISTEESITLGFLLLFVRLCAKGKYLNPLDWASPFFHRDTVLGTFFPLFLMFLLLFFFSFSRFWLLLRPTALLLFLSRCEINSTFFLFSSLLLLWYYISLNYPQHAAVAVGTKEQFVATEEWEILASEHRRPWGRRKQGRFMTSDLFVSSRHPRCRCATETLGPRIKFLSGRSLTCLHPLERIDTSTYTYIFTVLCFNGHLP